MSEIKGLRALADVDSPEVLHAAVQRLRRRVFGRIAWTVVTLVAASFIAVYIYDLARPPLARMGAPGASQPLDEQALQVGSAEVALLDARYYGDYVGLHFVALHPGVPHACVHLEPIPYTMVRLVGGEGAGGCGGGVSDQWSLIGRPVRGRVRFIVTDGYPAKRLGSFVLIVPRPGLGIIEMEAVFDGR